jgi:hypothetical protein
MSQSEFFFQLGLLDSQEGRGTRHSVLLISAEAWESYLEGCYYEPE